MNGTSPLPPNCDHIIRAHKLCVDLIDIMTLINSSHDIDEIFHKVVERSCKASGCDSVHIAIREGDNWVIRYVSNLPDKLIGRSFTDEELPHAALAMATKKPVAIDDAFHDDRTNTKLMESLGIKSVLVLPLMEKDVVTGTLLFGYHSGAVSFTDAEIDYAGRMTTGLAIALENAHLHQDVVESKKLDEALNKIDTILYSTQDYDVIMNKMLQLATDAIGAESAVIFSKGGERWTVHYEYKLPTSLLGQSFSNTEVMHTAITADTKRSLVVQDVLNSPEIDQKFVEMLGIRSLLDFPLILKGEVIGDLTFHYHSSPVPFNERQIEFVRKLQISISLALENGRLLDTSKQSESKLNEAEKLGKFGYFNYDVHTRKMTWSEGAFHVFKRDPALGEPSVEDFFELHSFDPGLEAMRELVGNKETSEFNTTGKCGGSVCDLHFVVRSVKDDKGDSVSFFGTIQDISERKRSEDALRESEERFHATFNQAAIGIGHLLPDGSWIRVNQKYCDVVGYSEEELRELTFNDITHPDDRETSMKHFQLLLEGKLKDYSLEKRLIRKDGSTVWVNLTASIVSDADSNPRFIVSVLEDITKRRNAEDKLTEKQVELKKLNSSLEVRIIQGIDELRQKDQMLIMQDRLAIMGEMINNIAHQWRQPLNTLGLVIQNLSLEFDAGELNREVLEESVAESMKLIQQMSQTIDDFKNFFKPGKELVAFSINQVIGHTVSFIEKSFADQKISIVFNPEGDPLANGYPNEYSQVLLNIFNNARDALVGLNVAEALISIHAFAEGSKTVVTITDNAGGVAEEIMGTLFDPYSTTKGPDKGTGIGLFMSKTIIEKSMGGRLTVRNTGSGAEFRIEV